MKKTNLFFMSLCQCCYVVMSQVWTRLKKTLHSGIELISEIPYQCFIITKTLFCRVSYCFCLFGESAKVFERQVWCVRVAHLHSAARALSSPSRCFQLSTNLDKDSFGCLLCWDKQSFDNSTNKIEIFIRVD